MSCGRPQVELKFVLMWCNPVRVLQFISWGWGFETVLPHWGRGGFIQFSLGPKGLIRPKWLGHLPSLKKKKKKTLLYMYCVGQFGSWRCPQIEASCVLIEQWSTGSPPSPIQVYRLAVKTLFMKNVFGHWYIYPKLGFRGSTISNKNQPDKSYF